jgi:predicted RNA binding protein YcfA (HicA-like mRNA interferase family)
MPKPQKYREVAAFLRSKGWKLLRQGKGSHEFWGLAESGSRLSLPRHRSVSAGIVKQIVELYPDEVPTGWK